MDTSLVIIHKYRFMCVYLFVDVLKKYREREVQDTDNAEIITGQLSDCVSTTKLKI